VAGSNRDRQRPKAESRIEAAAIERQKAAQRRKTLIAAGIAAVVVLIAVVALVTRSDDKKSTVATGGDAGNQGAATTTIPTTATAAVGSVAGKPCVAVSDPLPTGAPNVPVKEGPPPATLIHEDLKEGTGAEVAASSTLTVNYIGVSCSTGKIFDSSYSRGQPAQFPLANVIKGWQDGLVGMKVGGERLLGIPADQAYGSQGRPPTIAPDESLWFVVDVLDAT
jgi:peptidylprolyl isomerase